MVQKYIFSTIKFYPVLFFVIFLSFSNDLFSSLKFDKWGISQKRIMNSIISTETNYITFTPDDNPKYKNKILHYIIAINNQNKNNIKIIRSKFYPEKDYLFVKDKLYSILENYGLITNKKLNEIIQKLETNYGSPIIQKDKKLVIYTFSNKKTKVLLLSQSKHSKIKCKVYFYANNLFKMLMSE